METTSRFTASKLGPLLTQQGRKRRWLAREVGISEAFLSYLISGQRTASQELAERIAARLDVPLFFAFEFAKANDSVADAEAAA